MILDLIKSLIYGIVEGITEWLPVSSTGHMILLNSFLHFNNVSDGFFSMFEVVIQFGAILAVVALYWRRLWPWRRRDGKIVTRRSTLRLWAKIIAACIPAAIVGVLFDDKIEELFYHPVPIALALSSVRHEAVADLIQGCSYHRTVSGRRCRFPGHIPFRRHHHRRTSHRNRPPGRRRIHVLSLGSRDAWRFAS